MYPLLSDESRFHSSVTATRGSASELGSGGVLYAVATEIYAVGMIDPANVLVIVFIRSLDRKEFQSHKIYMMRNVLKTLMPTLV